MPRQGLRTLRSGGRLRRGDSIADAGTTDGTAARPYGRENPSHGQRRITTRRRSKEKAADSACDHSRHGTAE
jgi:hypothetical protein